MRKRNWASLRNSKSLDKHLCADDPSLSSQERSLVLSEMIVSYYNETDLESSGLHFVRFWNQSGYHFLGLEGLVFALHLEFGAWGLPDHLFSSYSEAAAALREELPAFRAAVKWLCSPKEPDGETAVQVKDPWIFEQAIAHGVSSELVEASRRAFRKRVIAASIPVTEEDIECLRYLENHGRNIQEELQLWGGRIVAVHSKPERLIDLFCRFLLDQCVNKDRNDLPVALCRGCQKLVVKHGNWEYCSEECRYRKFWTKEKRADDMYVRRLEDYSDAVLTTRLERPDVKDRLARIESTWPKASAIVALVGKIRRRASKVSQRVRERSSRVH